MPFEPSAEAAARAGLPLLARYATLRACPALVLRRGPELGREGRRRQARGACHSADTHGCGTCTLDDMAQDSKIFEVAPPARSFVLDPSLGAILA